MVYTGIIDKNNMLIIKTGETRRVFPGGTIVELGNKFGIIEEDHIRGGMQKLNTIWTKDDTPTKVIKFKKINSATRYRIIPCGGDGDPIEEEEILFGKMTVSLNGDVLYESISDIEPILIIGQAAVDYYGFSHEKLMNSENQLGYLFAVAKRNKIEKAFKKMCEKNLMEIEVDADKVCKAIGKDKMPASYSPNKEMKFLYAIKMKVKISQNLDMQVQQEIDNSSLSEQEKIIKYITEKNIKSEPTSSGLYVVVKKQGRGAKVKNGSKVRVNYVGRLLDGSIFDCNLEDVARKNGIYFDGIEYKPFEFIVGKSEVISGWKEGLLGQPSGSELTLIIPSELAYGERGSGEMIPPNSPLAFDITIVSVD